MVRLLMQADLALGVIIAGVLITLAFGVVAGHRAHRWLYYVIPAIGRDLPADTGAWLGLSFAVLLLAA